MEKTVFDKFAEVFARLPKQNGLFRPVQIFDEYPDQVMWNIFKEENQRSKTEKEISKKMAEVINKIFSQNVEQKAVEKYKSYQVLGRHLRGFMIRRKPPTSFALTTSTRSCISSSSVRTRMSHIRYSHFSMVLKFKVYFEL